MPKIRVLICVFAFLSLCLLFILAQWAGQRSELSQRLSPVDQSGSRPHYQVSPDGSDEADGTIEKPWRTIQFAADHVSPGDRVVIRKGIYQEIISFHTSGTKDKPILFQAEKGVVIRNPDNGPGTVPEIFSNDGKTLKCGWGDMIRVDADYLILDGFEVMGAKATGLGNWGCKDKPNNQKGVAEGFAKGVVYRNLIIRDHLDSGITVYHDSTIQHGIIKNNGREGDTLSHGIYVAGSDNLIEDNILEGNAGFGIHHHYGGRRNVIRRNVSFRNGSGGIVDIGRDNDIYNNTFVLNGNWGGWFSIWPKDGEKAEGYEAKGETRITNNIFAFNKHEQVNGEGDKNNVFKNNLCYANAKVAEYEPSANKENFLKSLCSLFADPRFVDLSKMDLRLRPDSPAIDKGVYAGLSFKGKAPDLGAYEYK